MEISSNPHIRLTVSDDGDYFEMPDEEFPGAEIQIINYRASLLGGHFEISGTNDNNIEDLCNFPALKKSEFT